MKAILFDCDGTLVDSETLATEVLVEMAAEEGLMLSFHEAVEQFRGRKLAECIADIERALGREVPLDFRELFRTRSAESFRLRLRAMDGAHALLESLSQRLCVASGAPREKVELCLSLTGLLPFFEGAIFSSYEVGSWKPDPGVFLHAAGALGVARADCAVVEDSLPGVLAGLAAGMRVFAYLPEPPRWTIPAEVTVIRHLSELKLLMG